MNKEEKIAFVELLRNDYESLYKEYRHKLADHAERILNLSGMSDDVHKAYQLYHKASTLMKLSGDNEETDE